VAQKAAREQLGAWRRFALKRLEKGRQADPFVADAVPNDLVEAVVFDLKRANHRQAVTAIFDEAGAQIEKRSKLPRRDRKAEKHLADVIGKYFHAQKASAIDEAKKHLKEDAA
jgi:hypothetical protein